MPDTISLATPEGWLPLAFAVVMALAILAYVILDGYDLGVGLLLRHGANRAEKNAMIATIGPFWDANETWLVLGVGVLLVAFPVAHGLILGALYLPVALMLVGLIVRGVAFDFRVKAHDRHWPLWDRAFWAGSLLASWAQGVMLGQLIVGFRTDLKALAFSLLIGFCLLGGYRLLGASWLILKTEGALQRKALRWARQGLVLSAAGVAAISLVTPLVSAGIYAKWFVFPNIVLLAPIPLATLLLFGIMARSLWRLPATLASGDQRGCATPFACAVGIFVLAFCGLAWSLFPWLIVDRINLWQAASAVESLRVIFYGVLVVLPLIIAYTAFSYRVFRGKAGPLEY